jgi:hypothetical protein
VFTALTLLLSLSPCDSYAAPAPFVIASNNHKFYVKVYPEPNTPRESPRATVTAYEVQAAEPDRQLWQSTNWFAWSIMLCDDGRHLVRFDDGVSFYEDGALLKAYTNAELNTESPWMGRPLPSFGAWPIERDLIRMTSIEQTERVFDLCTGEVVAVHADVPHDYSLSRSLRSPPRATERDLLSARQLVVIGLVALGVAVWFIVGYVKWKLRQRSRHDA